MRLQALVLDYDGTLAVAGHVAPTVLSGLERVRSAGVRLVLVSGRPLFDLIRAAESVERFDAVVAENGGVVYFPAENAVRVLGPPPPARLAAELDRCGVPFQQGRVVIAVAAADESRVRPALLAAGVQLEHAYSRDTLFLLPASISKGATVGQVIRELGLSPHDVLAVGDAENDLDLFEACGWCACPEDAAPAVRARVDWVVPARAGAGIAAAVADLVLAAGWPAARPPRHRLPLGWAAGSAALVTIPARGSNVLIQGDSLSGKSWLAGGLIERLLAGRYAVCVVDPEGDHRALAQGPGVSWIRFRAESSWDAVLERFERNQAACVVVDLAALPHPAKLATIGEGLARLGGLRRERGLPHWVVLEEAHYLLHPEGLPAPALGLEDGGFCFVTCRASWIQSAVLDAVHVLVLGRTADTGETAFLEAMLGRVTRRAGAVAAALPSLPRGQFVLIRSEALEGPTVQTFVAMPRETPHVRHQRKYVDTSLPTDKRFVFREPEGGIVATAGSLTEFQDAVATVSPRVLGYHAARRDFSRWVLGVFSDRGLGWQIRKIERRFSRHEVGDLRAALNSLVASRYGRPPGSGG